MVTATKKGSRKKGTVKVGKLEKAKDLSAGKLRKVKGGSVTDLIIDPFTARKPRN